jgi:TusA-related sulfurtransferase
MSNTRRMRNKENPGLSNLTPNFSGDSVKCHKPNSLKPFSFSNNKDFNPVQRVLRSHVMNSGKNYKAEKNGILQIKTNSKADTASKVPTFLNQTKNGYVDIFSAKKEYQITSYVLSPFRASSVTDNQSTEDAMVNEDIEENLINDANTRKHIPEWAKGNQIRKAIRNQALSPFDASIIFATQNATIDISKIFRQNLNLSTKQGRRNVKRLKRTSSQCWHT